MKITFEVPEGFNAELLLKDALIEFIQKRRHPATYCLERYSAEYLKNFPKKINEVAERVKMARQMLSSMEIEHETTKKLRLNTKEHAVVIISTA